MISEKQSMEIDECIAGLQRGGIEHEMEREPTDLERLLTVAKASAERTAQEHSAMVSALALSTVDGSTGPSAQVRYIDIASKRAEMNVWAGIAGVGVE